MAHKEAAPLLRGGAAEAEAQESFRPAVAAESGSVSINIADGVCSLHMGGADPRGKKKQLVASGFVWS